MSKLFNQVNSQLTSINCTFSKVPLPNANYHFVKRHMSIRSIRNNYPINPPKKNYGTISFNQENINSSVKSFRCFSVGGYNWRAVDGLTTDNGKDSNEGKLITKIEDIEDEQNYDQRSAKQDITLKPLNKRVIEQITENVDKIASKHLTEEQRNTLLYILKSNLVATALQDIEEMQKQINEKPR